VVDETDTDHNFSTMGASQSTTSNTGMRSPSVDGTENVNPLSGLGVATLVREIGMAMIPIHLKHTLESIMQIVDTFTKLRQFDQAPYTSHMIMLVALLRHVQLEDTGENVATFDTDRVSFPISRQQGVHSEDEALRHFLMDKRFGIFATNIYFSSLQLTKSQIASNMEMDPDDVVFVWMNDVDEEHCPKFLVLVDHLTLSVVLVIRGTFSFKDVLMDIVCEDAEFLDGFAHSGFLAGSRMVLNKCGSLLEKTLNDHFGYNLVICGHSMGGSVAMMITMELLRNDSSMVLPPGVSVRCVALGPAPVYRTEGEIPRIFREHIHIYTNDRDVVPRLSLGSVAKLLVTLRSLDNLELTMDEQLAVIMWRRDSETETNRTRLKSVVSSVSQNEFEFLHHPGSMYQVQTTEMNTVRVVVINQEGHMEENLEIHETMVSDHIHTAYRENFGKIYC